MKTKTQPQKTESTNAEKDFKHKINTIGFKLKLIALLLSHHSPQTPELKGFSCILDGFAEELRVLDD